MAIGLIERDTSTRILEVAEELVQIRGYNGFSYADISERLEVTRASVHYHFPSKAALGQALIARYSVAFLAELDRIAGSKTTAVSKLAAYIDVYAGVQVSGRMCLCGMLAAELPTLPDPMQLAVQSFFTSNQRWVADVLAQGETDGTLRSAGPFEDNAAVIISTLEGAMLISRPDHSADRFTHVAAQLLTLLATDTVLRS